MPGSAQVGNLFWWILGIAATLLILVAVLLIISISRGRPQDRNNQIQPSNDRRALTLAILAGSVPVVVILAILIVMFVLTGKEVSAANANPASGGVNIEITGHQWWWEVNYPGDGFETANEIHVPVGTPVILRLTSDDVIHSIWIPGVIQRTDMLPGHTSTITLRADKPGTYRGQCMEYCGLQHAYMDFLLIAQSRTDYDQWIAGQKQPAIDPAVNSIEKKGEQALLGSSCVYCHTIRGTNASGNLGPDLTHMASRMAIGAGARPNTPNDLAGWVLNAQTIKPGNIMPPMDLDADQLHAILAYLEALK